MNKNFMQLLVQLFLPIVSPLILEKEGLGKVGRDAVGVECGQVRLEKVLFCLNTQPDSFKISENTASSSSFSSGVITDLVRIYGDSHLF